MDLEDDLEVDLDLFFPCFKHFLECRVNDIDLESDLDDFLFF